MARPVHRIKSPGAVHSVSTGSTKIEKQGRRNTMDATKELTAEHEGVRTALAILDGICRELRDTGKFADTDHVKELLEFFTVFVDKCHHGKEEDLLFPAMENLGASRVEAPIGAMLTEHQRGREFVAGMKQALAEYHKGAASAGEEFMENAKGYMELLDHHIEKENTVLFPIASREFSESEHERMKQGFDRIETERVGEGRHEEFHKMLETLQARYVKSAE